MKRARLILCTVLAFGAIAHADTSKSDTPINPEKASEQALEAAADRLAAQVADTSDEATTPVAKAVSAPAKTVKSLPESEIPVLQSKAAKEHSVSSIWYRFIGSLAFISIIGGTLIFVVKRWSKVKNVGGKTSKIDLVHQFHLGPKKSLALVRVAGEHILVGVTEQNINMIKSIAFIDDEVEGDLPQDFNNFLEDEFTVEPARTAIDRTRIV